MKSGLTELVFILDKSGSMSGLESDTIAGYNSMLEKQKMQEGEAVVTTVLFDDKYELLHDRINIKGVKSITNKDYFVEGTTALLDALGKTIKKIENVQHNTSEDERAEKVVFIITTDGMENASREFTYEKIKDMIDHQKEKYKWEFIFLGANIDAVKTASAFGIGADRSANYHADGIGTCLNYEVVSDAISEIRSKKVLSSNWKDRIDNDFNNRKKGR